jgi:signal transduction histidine kinase
MWMGGFGWLSRFENGQFHTITRNQGFPAGFVKGITEVGTEIWLAVDSGIVRIDDDVFEKAIADPSSRLRFRVYDTSDGLAGTPVFAGNRTAARTPDGRLWFVTGKGLTIVDPQTLRGPGSHGPLRIEGLVADGHTIAARHDVRLRPRTSTIEIAYTAVNLTAAHKTRFKYLLKGFDTNWVDAGTRRVAFYTNLAPRQYEFQVIAENDDGSSSELSAPLQFMIRPAFYQTTSFYLMCALAAAFVGWGIWRVRVMQLRHEFSLLLGERLRMSREIHDTLLQGLFGVSLQLNALPRAIQTAPALAMSRVSRLRVVVDEYIRETREAIGNLRSPLLQKRDLVAALRHIGHTATRDANVAFEFTVAGAPRRFSPYAEQQVLRIGQEAVSNAVRHAAARRVQMMIQYDEQSVTLRVHDDGCGFDVAQLADAMGSHYGLSSMKERAEGVGGSFRLISLSGQGTQVEAIVRQ